MHFLRRAADFYLDKPLVRVATALVAVVGLALLQYGISKTALPVDVEKHNPKFTPAKARLGQEQISVVNPSADAVERMLLSGEGKDFETIDAYFDWARLHEDVLSLLQADPNERQLPSTGQVTISYTAAQKPSAQPGSTKSTANSDEEPCRTSLDVGWQQNSKPPVELFLTPLAGRVAAQTRSFEMQAMGSDLIVYLRTSDLSRRMRGAGCGKTLSVGDWGRSFSSPVLIKIVVPAGSKFRFNFTAAKGKSLQLNSNGFYEPFDLGARSLTAPAVRLLNVNGPASSPPALDVAVEEGKRPLFLRQLLVGINEIQLEFSGEAMVHENGKPAMKFDFMEFAKQNRLLAAMLGMIDLAVAAWFGRVLIQWLKTAFKSGPTE